MWFKVSIKVLAFWGIKFEIFREHVAKWGENWKPQDGGHVTEPCRRSICERKECLLSLLRGVLSLPLAVLFFFIFSSAVFRVSPQLTEHLEELVFVRRLLFPVYKLIKINWASRERKSRELPWRQNITFWRILVFFWSNFNKIVFICQVFLWLEVFVRSVFTISFFGWSVFTIFSKSRTGIDLLLPIRAGILHRLRYWYQTSS